MRVLAVAYDVPRADQSSGELRFATLLSLLAREHEVTLFPQIQSGDAGREAAVQALEAAGVRHVQGLLNECLRTTRFDVVLLEFYPVARSVLEMVRAWQPQARVIVDSVDVHFHRLRSKARLTGSAADMAHAEAVRVKELDAYRRADLVLAVSDDDARILHGEVLGVPVAVVPNIHTMHTPALRPAGPRFELVFVGSYKWAPNVDAMQFFCAEVMPLLRHADPALRVHLRIVGSSPTPEVLGLAAEDVEVVGFVEETTPVLMDSHVSIAPLRFGGGMKGKIGEAMAHGLPVVTTTIGAEGFGVEPGQHLLVADSPQAFADAVVALWRDATLRERIGMAGWQFIRDRYSVEAVGRLLPPLLRQAGGCVPQRLPAARRWRLVARHGLGRLVGLPAQP